MKLRGKKIFALLLVCVLLVTMPFSVTVKAYGEGISHAKQFRNCKVYHGIDVSTWNHDIDWNAVRASGIDFAFIKIGGRGWGSAGTLYHDSKAIQNIRGAKAAGMKVGVYMFSQAITELEAAEEAQYAISYLRAYGFSIDLPLVMDYEYASDSPTGGRIATANLSKDQVTNICMAFCNAARSNGYTPMVYANKNMLVNHMNADIIANNYPVWLAHYTNASNYKGAYSFWQYTSSGSVPGINGRVDMNVYYSPDGNYNFGVPNIPVPTGDTAPAEAKIAYSSHVQSFGWEKEESYDGQQSGTSGLAKRLEAIKIRNNTEIPGSVEYKVHCQSYGWLDWVADGDIAGVTGQSKRLEAIRIRLTGELAQKYDVYYRVHAQTFGWLDWAKNGETSGSLNYAKRLEAIQIMLVEKGTTVPSAGSSPYRTPGSIAYSTHVQSFGWQNAAYDGGISGTTGRAKRLEAIRISNLTGLDGSVMYRVHVQSYGWQSWVQNGQIAGTTGHGKRLEAIQIKLTGEMEQTYDIYYRVHAQSFGWLGWAKNGEPSGTAGYAKRLEAIQIVLVPRGGAAPGSTNRAYIGRAMPPQ